MHFGNKQDINDKRVNPLLLTTHKIDDVSKSSNFQLEGKKIKFYPSSGKIGPLLADWINYKILRASH